MARMEMQGFALAALAVALGGCSGSFQFSGRTAADDRPAQACVPSQGSFRVNALDWDEPARQELEAQVRDGAVVVRAEGCGWTVLRGCSVASKYAYRALPLRRDRHNSGSEMGMGVSSGPGVARSSGAVHDVAIAGAFDLERLPTTTELQGNCSGATHVLARYSAGAFQIEGGHSKSAGVSLYGAHAGTQQWTQSGRRVGKLEACETRVAGGPPVDCSALVDFEVVPLPPAAQPIAQPVATPAPAPVDACASGDLAACDLQCRSGSATACAALTLRCAAGLLPACMAAGSSSLERWLYAGK